MRTIRNAALTVLAAVLTVHLLHGFIVQALPALWAVTVVLCMLAVLIRPRW